MRRVDQAFQEWVAKTPDAVAVRAGTVEVSYAQLDAWSGRMAATLVSAGVRRGDHVGVRLPRSSELVAALLGVLRAGAAYVPLDPGEPPARLGHALAEANVRIVVGDAAAASALGRHPVAIIDPGATDGDGRSGGADRWAGTIAGGDDRDIAYLMYTSGSTGRPKAVMVEHRNVVNLVTEPNYVSLSSADTILHLAPAAFDAATFEIWAPLLNGARLVVAPPGPLTSADVSALLHQDGVTVLWLTAALFHRQVDEDVEGFRGIHTVIAGGDVLSVPHVLALRQAVPGCRILNGYGPTEATTFTCCYPVPSTGPLGPSVPIGWPLQNVRVHIMDGDGLALPDGEPGELYIGGAGVSCGYWRRPSLTAERFVPDPFSGTPGARLYRSGDAARRRGDGAVEFLGRVDDQFKLRGHRIEPGEVESVLTAHPQVRQAAVVLRRDPAGHARLVAHVVAAGPGPVDRRALRRHALGLLPGYLVPATFVVVPALPITPNGKVDRRALAQAVEVAPLAPEREAG